jgi:hypothetical protein
MSAPHTAALPLDMHRCNSAAPDSWCQSCMRYARAPWQTWGPATPSQITAGSQDEGCAYIPTPAARAAIHTTASTTTQEAA